MRSYLEHFFVDANDYSRPTTPYINDQYLKQVFAETKIVNGLGDGEKLYSMLPPEKYQQLKERIDIDFAFTNKTELAADEPVSLDVFVKNVDTLIVKVFEINTQNFYRENLREIGPDINLDGLVANEEKTYTLQRAAAAAREAAFRVPRARSSRRVRDRLHRQRQSQPGARSARESCSSWCAPASPGRSSRCSTSRTSRVREATLWLAGTLYTPDKEGTIVVPFSNQPGRQPIVLSLGGFSSLDYFQQEAENYSLAAAMYVDREELIARRKAQLIVRPRLWLNGTPVSRKSLEDVRLVITSTDLDGVVEHQEVARLQVVRRSRDGLRIPGAAAAGEYRFHAQGQDSESQPQSERSTWPRRKAFSINEIDRTDKTEDLHFARVGDDYMIDLLGKTGEAKADRPVQVHVQDARLHAAGLCVAADRRPRPSDARLACRAW